MSSSAQVRFTPPPPSAKPAPTHDATILHLAQAAEYHQASRSTTYTAQPPRPPPIVRPVVSQPNTVPNFREQAAAARRAVFEERRRAAVEARIKQQEERSAKRKKPAATIYNATTTTTTQQDTIIRSPHLVSSPSVLSFPPHGFNSNFLLPHQSDLLQQNLARKMAAKKLSKTEDLDRQKREMKKEARVREYEIALAMRWAAETKRREEAAQRRAQVDALRRRVEQEREEKRQLAKIKKRSKLSGESNSNNGSPNAFQTM
ncbi:hypothetical protein THRCLA_07036 [Thraustotheca clavata]|uniref:Uncharacterized protein n=1 Tax=Thraustotheca clavata TaxID=74557 RepID=A0A1V9ZH11_9STRA|nr:hypothetical protein THRCLA_07036 [Thraustotheca clavata]